MKSLEQITELFKEFLGSHFLDSNIDSRGEVLKITTDLTYNNIILRISCGE